MLRCVVVESSLHRDQSLGPSPPGKRYRRRMDPTELRRELEVILSLPTGKTSSGHPYLQEPAWRRFRDWVPHILDDGPRVLAAIDGIAADRADGGDAAKVVRQIVLTAAITAPSDLWLLRHVVAAFHRLGLSQRLLDDETLRADRLVPLLSTEVQVDLRFLLTRGLLRGSKDGGVRVADHAAARAVFAWQPSALPSSLPSSLATALARLFRGSNCDDVKEGLASWLSTPLPAKCGEIDYAP